MLMKLMQYKPKQLNKQKELDLQVDRIQRLEKNYTDDLVGNLVAENPFNKPTRRPTPSPIKTVYDAPMPTRTTDTVRKPTRGSAGRPMRVPQESMTGSDGSVYPAVKPMDERARRRRDNALKSEVDEMTRQFNKQRPRRPRRPTAQPIRQPRPIRLPKDFGGRKPRQNSMGLGPLPNNFNPLESTALTDRFNKPIDRGPMPNARTQRRNKGGDIKKYAVGGLNKGMTKSRTKYGTVDNKKK
jgi:hypothetical protein